MNESSELERGYRRLLALYPPAFRREHEEEMLTVLMAGAAPGQTQPRRGESADLLWNAVRERFMSQSTWEMSHRPDIWLVVRLVITAWLLLLTAILCANGYWWGLALLLAVAAHLVYVIRLRAAIRTREGRDRPPYEPPSPSR